MPAAIMPIVGDVNLPAYHPAPCGPKITASLAATVREPHCRLAVIDSEPTLRFVFRWMLTAIENRVRI
jgi:hypothetical protein